MKNNAFRLLAVLLIAAMILCAVPSGALAASASYKSRCPVCGNKKGWKADESACRAPTCTSKGTVAGYCLVCGADGVGAYVKKSVKALGHNWGDWTVVKEATCTAYGLRRHACKRCGKTEQERIGKRSHTWGEWTVITEAGRVSSGLRQHTCSACGSTEQETYEREGVLRQGDRGDRVKDLQDRLKTKHFYHGTVDGIYGKMTAQAVSELQLTLGLPADGIARVGLMDLGTPCTVTVYGLNGEVDHTCEVTSGEPTDLDLPAYTDGGQAIRWYRKDTYGKLAYRPGMVFTEDAELWPDTDDTVSVQFVLEGRVIAEYRVPRGEKIRCGSSGYPFMVYEGLFLEWYTGKEGTGEQIWEIAGMKEDLVLYGAVRGHVSLLTLRRLEDVYVNPYGSVTEELPGGEIVTVVQSFTRGTDDWYRILYGDGQNQALGYLRSPKVEARGDQPLTYLDANGGTVEPNVTEARDAAEFPTPVLEGRTFLGWEYVSGLWNTDLVYRAKWEAIPEYRLRIDWQVFKEMWFEDWAVVREGATDYELPVPEAVGYEFTGWKAAPWSDYGKGAIADMRWRSFTPGEPITEELLLQAQYREVETFELTFDMTVFDPVPAQKVNSGAADYTLPVPEKDGYEFTGWCVTRSVGNGNARANGNVRAFTPGEPIRANLTLQPQYRQTKGYTITFDAGEGNTAGDSGTRTMSLMTAPDGTITHLPDAKSSDQKAVFEGWYTSGGKLVKEGTTRFTGNAAVEARWSHKAGITIE